MDDKYWIHQGDPDDVAFIPNTKPEEGGYLLIVVLENGSFQILATRFPGRSITGWKTKIKRVGGAPIIRVLVSLPIVMHEHMKRRLLSYFDFEDKSCSIEMVKKKTEELMDLDQKLTKTRRTFSRQVHELHKGYA